jgi:hypothetical protein
MPMTITVVTMLKISMGSLSTKLELNPRPLPGAAG